MQLRPLVAPGRSPTVPLLRLPRLSVLPGVVRHTAPGARRNVSTLAKFATCFILQEPFGVIGQQLDHVICSDCSTGPMPVEKVPEDITEIPTTKKDWNNPSIAFRERMFNRSY